MSLNDINHTFSKFNDPSLQMYYQMTRIRHVEDAIAKVYPEQEIRCPVHLCTGQEAPPVGVSMHLRQSDLVFSGHRSHGHYLAKGGDLRSMIAELYGKVTGCARGKGGSQHLIDLSCGFMGSAPILASTVSVAAGAAWGKLLQGQSIVTVAYIGDGATEEGAFHETLNFVGTNKLPVIFVCENNLYSVHSAKSVRQPSRSIWELASAHDLYGLQGDGNDVEEVYKLAEEVISRARNGQGGSILELFTYRWAEHCGPNDDSKLGYRSSNEIQEWKNRDPIIKMRANLVSEGKLNELSDREIHAEIETEINEAFEFARKSEFPPVEELFKDVFPD